MNAYFCNACQTPQRTRKANAGLDHLCQSSRPYRADRIRDSGRIRSLFRRCSIGGRRWGATLLVFLTLAVWNSTHAAEIAAADRTLLNEARNVLRQAGRQYRSGKLQQASVSLDKVEQLLDELPPQDPEIMRFAEPLRKSLVNAQKLLRTEAVESDADVKQPASVSFATDLAETLADRCIACHGESRARQGLRVDSYANLLKGSSDGPVIQAGNAQQSLLIQKLKGEAGDRMPPNGPPLTPEMIGQFATWIAEGANFDGNDQQLNLQRLVIASKRATMDAEELVLEARETAAGNWSLAFPDRTPELLYAKPFLIVAAGDMKDLEQLGKFATAAFSRVAKLLPEAETSLKSPLTIYWLPRRYDYAEFVQMVEKRDADSAANAHWRSDGGAGYLVIGPPESQATNRASRKSSPIDESELEHFVAAMLMNRWGAPTWYADGVGRNIKAKLHRRDPDVAAWQARASDVLPRIKSSKEIFDDGLTRVDMEVATWALVRTLMSDGRRMRGLHAAIAAGESFEKSFQSVYGKSAADVGDAWLTQFKRNRKY